jgi:hypothetical protein
MEMVHVFEDLLAFHRPKTSLFASHERSDSESEKKKKKDLKKDD